MSETQVQEPASAQPGLTAGAMLRQAREATGLHIAALAVSLKVSVRKLEALEGDRFDELPDAVFVRGLASAVCRALRIDAEPILARLPQRVQPVLIPVSTQQETFAASQGARLTQSAGVLGTPALWAVVVLLVGAAVIAFLPQIKGLAREAGWLGAAMPAGPNAAAPVLPVPAPAPSGMALDSVATNVAQPASVAAPASATVGTAASDPAAASSQPQPALVVAPALAVQASAASAASAAGTENVLRFTARASTWVEVIDRYGAVAHKGTVAAGETVTVGGRVPLAVTVGRADGVSVQVRGQAFDLAAVSKANVARFEVK